MENVEMFDSDEEDMTYDEKRDLICKIIVEPLPKILEMIQMIHTLEPKSVLRLDETRIQVDFDNLFPSTLRKLSAELEKYYSFAESHCPQFRGLNKLRGQDLLDKVEHLEEQINYIDSIVGFVPRKRMKKYLYDPLDSDCSYEDESDSSESSFDESDNSTSLCSDTESCSEIDEIDDLK